MDISKTTERVKDYDSILKRVSEKSTLEGIFYHLNDSKKLSYSKYTKYVKITKHGEIDVINSETDLEFSLECGCSMSEHPNGLKKEIYKYYNCKKHTDDLLGKIYDIMHKFGFNSHVYDCIDNDIVKIKDGIKLEILDCNNSEIIFSECIVKNVKVKRLLEDKYRQYGFLDVFGNVELKYSIRELNKSKLYPIYNHLRKFFIQISTDNDSVESALIQKMNYFTSALERIRERDVIPILINQIEISEHMRDFENITINELNLIQISKDGGDSPPSKKKE